MLTHAALLRRAWIPVVATLIVTGVALLIGSVAPGRWVTESVVIVPSSRGEPGPGAATEATRLAVTYAASIPNDAGVLYEAASRLHRSPESISRSIKVINDPNTAVLRIRFEATDKAEALLGARAILEALTSPGPRARSVPPRSLLLVQPPRPISGGGSGSSLAIGVVLGLCLGVVAAIAWERADPRIDVVDHLEAVLDCPSIALATLSPGSAASLLDRWRFLAGDESPKIALIAGAPGMEASMSSVAERLRAVLEAGGSPQVAVRDMIAPDVVPRDRELRERRGRDRVVLMVAGMPGEAGFAEWTAAAANVVVFVVRDGARQARLLRATDRLGQLTGKSPDWGLLIGRGDVRPEPPAQGASPAVAERSSRAAPVVGLKSSRARPR
jgi:capsular polysaccharide biosynthesis protein